MREPAGGPHGQVQATIIALLINYVRPRRLGIVCGEVGLWLARDPDTVKGPDVNFFRAERVPNGRMPEGYSAFPADLAVEVRSPNDRKGEEEARVAALLDGGVRLVWHVEPLERRATIHAPGLAPEPLGEDDVLDGRGVIPGFRCRLHDALDW